MSETGGSDVDLSCENVVPSNGTLPDLTKARHSGHSPDQAAGNQPISKHPKEPGSRLDQLQAVLCADRRIVTQGNGILPEILHQEAEYDLHEKQEWIERDVQALREMVEAEDGLNSRTDQAFLLTFLRARKFDYEKALCMIKSYYRLQRKNCRLYADLVPSRLAFLWDLQIQTVLSDPDSCGRTVILFSTDRWNPRKCSLDDILRAQILILEHIVRLPVTQLKGVAAVVDCKGLTFNHVSNLTPSYIKNMVSVIQEVFPLRFKALHFIHEPALFEWVFSLVRPFLSETLCNRLHFHGDNVKELHEHISSHILPKEFGGTRGGMENNSLIQELYKHEDYFKENFSYGYSCSAVVDDTDGLQQSSYFSSVPGLGPLLGSYYQRLCMQ